MAFPRHLKDEYRLYIPYLISNPYKNLLDLYHNLLDKILQYLSKKKLEIFTDALFNAWLINKKVFDDIIDIIKIWMYFNELCTES